MDIETLKAELVARDKGVLKYGSHAPDDHEFCALEFSAVVRGKALDDTPGDLPDLRRLNDARWSSDEARTEALLPVMVALWDWRAWSKARKIACVSHIAIQMVRRIVSELPFVPEAIRRQCLTAETLAEANAAARAAAYAAHADAAADAAAAHAAADAAAHAAARAAAHAAARAAAHAAHAAARAAAYAAASAAATASAYAAAYAAYAAADAAASAAATAAHADAAADRILMTACQIWIEAAHATA